MADEPAARSKVRTALAGAGALLAAVAVVIAAYRLGHPAEPSEPAADPDDGVVWDASAAEDGGILEPEATTSVAETTAAADPTDGAGPTGGASPTPENEKDPLAGEGDAETATLPFENEKDPGAGNG